MGNVQDFEMFVRTEPNTSNKETASSKETKGTNQMEDCKESHGYTDIHLYLCVDNEVK